MYRRGDFVLAPTFGETAKALQYLASPGIKNRDENDMSIRRPMSSVSETRYSDDRPPTQLLI